MATTKKKNNGNRSNNKEEKIDYTERLKQAKLGLGILFLLAGVFVSFSIISYCFTWQVDQDLLLSEHGLNHFVFKDKSSVANWGGRLGAAISHVLVYKGVGIAALAIGIILCLFAFRLLYNSKKTNLSKYLRWLSIALLLIAPILAYTMPSAKFPFGGAWGNEAITYLNGIMGTAGTGMVLFAIVCFFLFVVFALDISPLIKKARRTANKMATAAAALKPEKTESTSKEENQELEEDDTDDALKEMAAPPESANQLNNDNATILFNSEEEVDEEIDEELDMQLIEKQEDTPKTINELYAEKEEDVVEVPVEEASTEVTMEVPPAPTPTPKKAAKEETEEEDISFEVTKKEDEKTTPKHGGHISIEDGEPYAPELDLPNYKFPTLDLLEERSQESIVLDKAELEKNKNQIIQTLRSFGIEIQRISATVGPTVTLYEIVPAEGVRISKIRNLEDDIALNLAALGIRIIAPIPGRGTIGIEVPNANKQIVRINSLLASEKFRNTKMSLPIALGKKIDNELYIVDLAKMPHLLMAGATGQGKSVGINTILVSLLYKKHPAQLKFVMVDPKKVELSVYRTIEKHFLAMLPNEEEAIITDTKKVINTLNALCIEMDNRYDLLKEARARNIKEYNDKFIKRRLNPENGHQYLPFIVLVVDEFADLIMTAGKEVEMPIARLAQLARAVGIHLIIATQRPSVNVITGTIKANFPARIAFKVSAKVDSRTILDAGGAEQLIGRGDMLISYGSELLRLQCAFVDTPEVEEIVEFIGEQQGYPSAFELPEYEGEEGGSSKDVDLTNRDKLFAECARQVVQTQSGSTSMLQRRFNLGYNRAGRIMDQLEASGIVGPSVGSKPREVLMHTESELEQFLNTI
ncbi:MAG: DNA translocase FtsK 4TM domain-containing protein [Flavipsychrobacter sp.]